MGVGESNRVRPEPRECDLLQQLSLSPLMAFGEEAQVPLVLTETKYRQPDLPIDYLRELFIPLDILRSAFTP